MKTIDLVFGKKRIGNPFNRSMFSGVTRSILDGSLVVTRSILPAFMTHPRDRIEVPPGNLSRCLCVASLRISCVHSLLLNFRVKLTNPALGWRLTGQRQAHFCDKQQIDTSHGHCPLDKDVEPGSTTSIHTYHLDCCSSPIKNQPVSHLPSRGIEKQYCSLCRT